MCWILSVIACSESSCRSFRVPSLPWFEHSVTLTLSLIFQKLVSELEPKPPRQSSAPPHQVRAGLPSQRPGCRHDRHGAGRRRDHSRIPQHRPGSQRAGPLPRGQRLQLRELLRRQRGPRGSPRKRQLPPTTSVQSRGAPQPISKTDEVIRGVGHMIAVSLQPEGWGVLEKLPYSVIIITIIFFLY